METDDNLCDCAANGECSAGADSGFSEGGGGSHPGRESY